MRSNGEQTRCKKGRHDWEGLQICLSEVDSKKLTLCCTRLFPTKLPRKPAQEDEPEADTHMCLYSSHTHCERDVYVSFSLPTASLLSVNFSYCAKTLRKALSAFPLPLKCKAIEESPRCCITKMDVKKGNSCHLYFSKKFIILDKY